MSIEVQPNRKFDQFLFINQPINPSRNNPNSIMVNGPKFNKLLRVDNSKPIEMPLYQKNQDDAVASHCRNSFIKEQLFYHSTQGNEVKTYCLRLENNDPHRKIKNIGIPIANNISIPDTYLQFTKSVDQNITEIFEMPQVLMVLQGDQTATLQTRLPNSQGINQKQVTMVQRQSCQFYQQKADLPFISYNLGSQRLLFTHITNPDV